MSRTIITASVDASIYEQYASLNTGQDEILEVGKKQHLLTGTNGRARSLIKFTLTDLVGAPTTSAAYLNLKVANATKLNQDALVYIFPASRSWDEGSGYFEQRPIKNSDDGSTWTTYASASNWSTAGGDFTTGSGHITSGLVVSASVADIKNNELKINVTPIIQPMISASVVETVNLTGASYNDDPTITHATNANVAVGMLVVGTGIPAEATVASVTSNTIFELSVATTGGSKTSQALTLTENSTISNNGLVMTFLGSATETNRGQNITLVGPSDGKDVGNIKFFSRNTQTIHAPTLELSWLNHSIVTGSLKTLPSLDIEIAPRNMKAKYRAGEVSKMYFTVRDRYPAKTFANTRRFDNRYYLPPSGSTYTIVDAGSGTTTVPFDEYSHLDCDVTGSYVMLDTKPLHKNRFYDLSLKVVLSNEVYFSRPFRFKVV